MVLLGQVLFWMFALAAYIAVAVYMVLNPTVVGNAIGFWGIRHVNRRSPAFVVRFAGCLMLGFIPGRVASALIGYWWAGMRVAVVAAIGLYVWLARWRPLHDEVWD